jgi:hypothetical protein
MQSGRVEHRLPVNLAGRLENAATPVFSEIVSIVNISSSGARVITRRNWQPHDHVLLLERIGDFHADAEVIYCQRLRDDAYVVGLRFERSITELLTQPRRVEGYQS